VRVHTTTSSIGGPRRNLVIIAAIIAIAISLSLISYQYSRNSAMQIEQISVRDIRSNAEIQAYDISNSFENKIDDITSMLQVLAASRSVQNGDLGNAASVFDEAQLATSNLVDFYMWLDKDGKVVWISNLNQTAFNQYRGLDLSYRLYFSEPKATHNVYYSSVVDSNDRINRIYISYPITEKSGLDQPYDSAGIIGAVAEGDQFKGTIVAGIRTDMLGNYLEDQISPALKGRITLVDHTGIILYSKDAEYMGKNVFGIRFQSLLQSYGSDTAKTFSSGFKQGLQGQPGSEEIFSPARSAFVYSPVLLEGNQFGLLYIIVPYTQVAEVTALVESQKNLSFLIIIAVGASAVTAAFVTIRWNKELERTIAQRTAELRQANEQLTVNDKLQKEFINIAAHELRTPIQPILGMSEVLESEFGDSREEIKMIARNAKRLERLTQDILDVSKIESGSLTLNKQKMDLDEAVSPIIIDYRNNPVTMRGGENKGETTLKIRYEPKKLIVEADKDRIQQVVSNLINNAIKFTTEVGEVSVKTEVVDDFAKVTIKDTGAGIHQEIMPRLFQKFATKSERGTGLGLFISKSIVEAHGGRIWAENNIDGKGATFTFTLPMTTKNNEQPL
jgi:signal transduction histidine kinase